LSDLKKNLKDIQKSSTIHVYVRFAPPLEHDVQDRMDLITFPSSGISVMSMQTMSFHRKPPVVMNRVAWEFEMWPNSILIGIPFLDKCHVIGNQFLEGCHHDDDMTDSSAFSSSNVIPQFGHPPLRKR
jgi:hypothetical protein